MAAGALLCLCLSVLVRPTLAEKLVSQLSSDTIEITSSFDGETLVVFGSIEADAAGQKTGAAGPYQVVVAITGPLADRVARQKTNNFGIWLNTDGVTFRNFPSYYQVLSSARLEAVTDATTLAIEHIPPDTQAGLSEPAGWWKSAVFGREIIRMMTQKQLFGLNESAVNFLSATVYSARLTLPGNAPPGRYIAVTYVFRNGQIVARGSQGFVVSKIGFERFLAIQSRQNALLYGIVCVLLAVCTGWLGRVIFRRN